MTTVLTKHFNRKDSLTEEEEKELFEKIKNNDEYARQELLQAHKNFLILYAFNNYRKNCKDIDALIKQGHFGLIKAVDLYIEKNKTCRFMEYAIWWVRAHMNYFMATN